MTFTLRIGWSIHVIIFRFELTLSLRLIAFSRLFSVFLVRTKRVLSFNRLWECFINSPNLFRMLIVGDRYYFIPQLRPSIPKSNRHNAERSSGQSTRTFQPMRSSRAAGANWKILSLFDESKSNFVRIAYDPRFLPTLNGRFPTQDAIFFNHNATVIVTIRPFSS